MNKVVEYINKNKGNVALISITIICLVAAITFIAINNEKQLAKIEENILTAKADNKIELPKEEKQNVEENESDVAKITDETVKKIDNEVVKVDKNEVSNVNRVVENKTTTVAPAPKQTTPTVAPVPENKPAPVPENKPDKVPPTEQEILDNAIQKKPRYVVNNNMINKMKTLIAQHTTGATIVDKSLFDNGENFFTFRPEQVIRFIHGYDETIATNDRGFKIYAVDEIYNNGKDYVSQTMCYIDQYK